MSAADSRDLAPLVEAVSAGQPVALVTGANKGIGFETARGLARRGCVVLLGARDRARGASAAADLQRDGLAVVPLTIDITDDDSVRAAAELIEVSFGRLDVLVNNAAVKFEFSPAPPSSADMAIVRTTYETNVFGTMRMLLAMLPLLRRARAARVVNVSSSLGSLTLASTEGSMYQRLPMLGYSTSKSALNAVTVQFANELRETPIKVNVADPGYTKTDMTRNDGRRSPARAAELVIELALLDDDGPTGGYFDEQGVVAW